MAMIDFHAHILPGADHGSDCSATSLKQLALMQQAGVEAVVATPHFYPHYESVEAFLQSRARGMRRLFRKLPAEGVPSIYVGAEVLLCPGMHEMEQLGELAIAGTKVILLEMPSISWSDALLDTVVHIKKRGLFPILAHIDRYPMEMVQKLLERGISAQLNAHAFSGFSRGAAYRPIIADGTVLALGSDLHGAKRKAYKPFEKMLKRLGADAELVFSRTEALLRGAIPLTEMEIPPSTRQIEEISAR